MAEMERVNIVDLNLDYDDARLSERYATNMIVVHNTGNPTDDDMGAERINEFHRRENDWAAIGYHFVIRKDGTIERGRPEWASGAHAVGYNSESIGICVSGNFMIGTPTPAQIESLAMLLANLCADYNLPIDRDHILGHRELNDTDCPGDNLYNMMREIVGKANFYRYPPEAATDVTANQAKQMPSQTDSGRGMSDEALAHEIALGLINTGIEGNYDSVECSTAGDYPSIGVSQWEGDRADALLDRLETSWKYVDQSYSQLVLKGLDVALMNLLDSPHGRQIQIDYLTEDCIEYVKTLHRVKVLIDPRCIIYAGMWCPTSTYVVKSFLLEMANEINLNSLEALKTAFYEKYADFACIQSRYYQGYRNRAERTYQYVAGIDLTTPYQEPIYGSGPNGR